MTTRRTFLGVSALAASALSLQTKAADSAKSQRPLEVLVLGGTGFIGPHQVNALLDRGHKVTLFNRGRKTGLFEGRVEELAGNRDAKVDDGLEALKGDRRWDVVIDNSGYVPRHVRDSAELLAHRCNQYLYISTVAVYDLDLETGDRSLDRNSPIWSDIPNTEQVNGETYGPLKAACDVVVEQVLGSKATIVRPTYVVGPGDVTDRFTYWVDRIHRGGDVLAPADPDLEAQWIDVRDLAQFVVGLVESRTLGTFNAAGPRSRVTNQTLMWGLAASSSAAVRFHWPSPELLESMKLQLPMMPPRRWSRHIDSGPAQQAGLQMRPLADTARDLQAWWQAQPAQRRSNPRGWLSAEQEAQAIARIGESG